MESRRVTIVQYDLTSSEDEKDSDQTYVYSSSKLSPLSASEFLFEPPAEGDQSDHSEQNSVLVLESDSASDDAGITIYVQNYKTSKFAGSDTVPPVKIVLKKLESVTCTRKPRTTFLNFPYICL